jgi:hypothetical protein
MNIVTMVIIPSTLKIPRKNKKPKIVEALAFKSAQHSLLDIMGDNKVLTISSKELALKLVNDDLMKYTTKTDDKLYIERESKNDVEASVYMIIPTNLKSMKLFKPPDNPKIDNMYYHEYISTKWGETNDIDLTIINSAIMDSFDNGLKYILIINNIKNDLTYIEDGAHKACCGYEPNEKKWKPVLSDPFDYEYLNSKSLHDIFNKRFSLKRHEKKRNI